MNLKSSLDAIKIYKLTDAVPEGSYVVTLIRITASLAMTHLDLRPLKGMGALTATWQGWVRLTILVVPTVATPQQSTHSSGALTGVQPGNH